MYSKIILMNGDMIEPTEQQELIKSESGKRFELWEKNGKRIAYWNIRSVAWVYE